MWIFQEQLITKKLQHGASTTTTTALERELALKTKKVLELQGQLDQLREMLLEVPVLKKDLQKSRQETKGLSEVLFSSRKENVKLKDLVAKLNKQVKSNETLSEINYKELQGTLKNITQERDQNMSEVKRLSKLLEQKDSELQRNRSHYTTLNMLVDRLEVRKSSKYFVAVKSILPVKDTKHMASSMFVV